MNKANILKYTNEANGQTTVYKYILSGGGPCFYSQEFWEMAYWKRIHPLPIGGEVTLTMYEDPWKAKSSFYFKIKVRLYTEEHNHRHGG